MVPTRSFVCVMVMLLLAGCSKGVLQREEDKQVIDSFVAMISERSSDGFWGLAPGASRSSIQSNSHWQCRDISKTTMQCVLQADRGLTAVVYFDNDKVQWVSKTLVSNADGKRACAGFNHAYVALRKAFGKPMLVQNADCGKRAETDYPEACLSWKFGGGVLDLQVFQNAHLAKTGAVDVTIQRRSDCVGE